MTALSFNESTVLFACWFYWNCITILTSNWKGIIKHHCLNKQEIWTYLSPPFINKAPPSWNACFLLHTLQELQYFLPYSRGFIMVVYEKIYFEAYTNDWYIWHKNNIAQLYFYLGRAKLCWIFSSLLTSHIHRAPTVHMVKTHILVENLVISGASSGILQNVAQLSLIN